MTAGFFKQGKNPPDKPADPLLCPKSGNLCPHLDDGRECPAVRSRIRVLAWFLLNKVP